MLLYSVMKYFGGYGDVIVGVVVCGEYIVEVLCCVCVVIGGLLYLFGVYLLYCGFMILFVCVCYQQESVCCIV